MIPKGSSSQLCIIFISSLLWLCMSLHSSALHIAMSVTCFSCWAHTLPFKFQKKLVSLMSQIIPTVLIIAFPVITRINCLICEIFTSCRCFSFESWFLLVIKSQADSERQPLVVQSSLAGSWKSSSYSDLGILIVSLAQPPLWKPPLLVKLIIIFFALAHS